MKTTIDVRFEKDFPIEAKAIKAEIKMGLVVETSNAINAAYAKESDPEKRQIIAFKYLYLYQQAFLFDDGVPALMLANERINNSQNQTYVEDAIEDQLEVLEGMPLERAQQLLLDAEQFDETKALVRPSTRSMKINLDKLLAKHELEITGGGGLEISDLPTSESVKKVTEAFSKTFPDHWKKKPFKRKDDYNYCVRMLACFFERKYYSVPQKPLSIGCRTRSAILRTIGALCDEFGFDRNEEGLFEICRCLDEYTGAKDETIYNAIRK